MAINDPIMYDIVHNEITTSTKRVVGAALFGIILGGYLNKALSFTIPAILSMVQKIDLQVAQINFKSSIVLVLIVQILVSFFAAVVAAFIARRKGVLVGLLSNSTFIILLAVYLISAISEGSDELVGHISLQLYTFISLLLTVLAGIFGGFFGQRFYSPDKDIDLGNDKLTVFGMRWAHYFWVLPFIIYPYLASIIMIIYAVTLCLLADFYFGIHPSLWLNVAWWIYFFAVPIGVFFAVWITFRGLIRFYELMQYRQMRSRGWKKFGLVLLYGIGAPILSYSIAAFGADIIHNMPRPSSGDWKIVLFLVLIIFIIAVLIWIFSWIKKRMFHKD
jgi:hypothetical protein